MLVKYTPYILGVALSILAMMLRITPDFIFIIVAILGELSGVFIYILFYLAYTTVADTPLREKIQADHVSKSLYYEAITLAVLVVLVPLKLNVISYNLVTYIWMAMVMTHIYLVCELAYYSTKVYLEDIRNLG